MSAETSQLYEFGPFRLDGIRRVLWRDGQPVPLTAKVFETLVVLIESRGHVVEKDALLKAIWPESFVEESNLAQNVSALRKALGEFPGENRYIVTVPGRGYRFVADVRPISPQIIEQSAVASTERRTTADLIVEEEIVEENARQNGPVLTRRRLQTIAALTALSAIALGVAGWRMWKTRPAPDVAATRTIAVLPFQALTPHGENTLGLGLADAVITKLTNIRQLVVRPTSSILKYAGPSADPWAAGRELDVEAVLDGKVQATGDRVRVTVQLVRVSDRRPLWAETFDQSFTNIFGIEDAISEKVAQALAVRLRVERRSGWIAAIHPTWKPTGTTWTAATPSSSSRPTD